MTVPNGAAGITAGNWAVSGTGISGLQGRTQDAVQNSLRGGVQQSPGAWGGLAAGLGNSVFGHVNDSYVAQLPTIDEHSKSIAQLYQNAQVDTFTTSGPWVKPARAKMIDFYVVSGGSGGAQPYASYNQAGAASGGGPCGYTQWSMPANVIADQCDVTVGNPGAGATTDQTAGAQGTISGVGAHGSGSYYLFAQPGAGGNPGTVNVDGAPAAPGVGTVATSNYGGWGGASSTSTAYPQGSSGGPGMLIQGAPPGTPGVNGGPPPVALFGPGSGAGGGYRSGFIHNGWNGGNGGFPGGAGGGGSVFIAAGFNGNGGWGAGGQVVIVTHFS